MKKILLFIIIFPAFIFSQNFIISSNNKTKNIRSKTSLKEDIGFEIKDILNTFADLNKKIAEVHIEISNLQKHFIEKSENLIDNKKPFKKAGRGELNQALRLLRLTSVKLSNELLSMNKIKEEFNENNCLKINSIEKKA